VVLNAESLEGAADLMLSMIGFDDCTTMALARE